MWGRSIYWWIHRSMDPSLPPSIHASMHPSIHLSIYGSIYRSIDRSIYLSIVSIYLSIYLPISLCLSLSLSHSLSFSVFLSLSLCAVTFGLLSNEFLDQLSKKVLLVRWLVTCGGFVSEAGRWSKNSAAVEQWQRRGAWQMQSVFGWILRRLWRLMRAFINVVV